MVDGALPWLFDLGILNSGPDFLVRLSRKCEGEVTPHPEQICRPVIWLFSSLKAQLAPAFYLGPLHNRHGLRSSASGHGKKLLDLPLGRYLKRLRSVGWFVALV